MLLLMPLDFTCGLSFSVNYANYNMETRDQIYLNYLTHYTTRWGILYLTGTCFNIKVFFLSPDYSHYSRYLQSIKTSGEAFLYDD